MYTEEISSSVGEKQNQNHIAIAAMGCKIFMVTCEVLEILF